MPALGLGIRPRGPSTLPSRPTDPHHVRGGDHGVEVQPAALDLLRQVVAADEVGAGLLGLADLLAAGEDQHARRLAQAVRQHHRAADHLVGVLGVDAQAHGDLERLVELGVRDVLRELDRLAQRIGPGSRPSAPPAGTSFRASPRLFPPVSSPRLISALDLEAHRARRALDGLDRRVEVRGVQVGHLGLGDLLDLRLGDLARPSSCSARPSPCRSPAALSSRIAAGGVLVMNV